MDELQLASTILTAARQDALQGLGADLLEAAVRYARIRADWALATAEQRRAMDQTRTRAHEVLIDACNILSREMGRQGADNAWRGHLGEDRRRIGDVACHLHCLLGLSAR